MPAGPDPDEVMENVECAWDDEGGMQGPKSKAGRRTVPLAPTLRRELVEHKLRTGRDRGDLVFGREAGAVFVPTTVRSRAHRAWVAAGLEPLTLHEARHCCASYFIAAGMNLKEISVWIGHSTVGQTIDRYGHLIPGGEAEASAKLEAYLTGSGG